MRFRVQGVDHVAFGVADQRASEAFYRDVLGLERAHEGAWGDTPLAMMAEHGGMALFKEAGRGNGFRHMAFRVDRENFELAREDLREAGIEFEIEHHHVSESLYFVDPDGNRLELTTYDV
ncbi:MAG TPA: VOC family protein [Thermoleophilaceae bacterium]|nr:VOC family protein [Thermoleophilaceae bacterium]